MNNPESIQRYRLNAEAVLRRYKDEDLPAFCEIELTDVNQEGNFGERPLDVAATRGNLDEIVALLEGGAYIDTPGEHGFTALHAAVMQGHAAAVKLLLDYGARQDLKNDWGQTAIDVACNPDVCALLYSHRQR
jgi:ankyrin repeat protein